MQDLPGIPFWNRLSVRLMLLLLGIVAVLSGAAAILLLRGFSLAQQGLEPGADPSAIVRGTVINLIAVFLLTLLAAALFSRSLLTEPIAGLARATRELASGRLGVTLPVTSRSELGMLAEAFNTMSLRLAERNHELLASHEALRRSEARYELAVRGANDGLWDWDLRTGALYLSPRWKAMLGWAEDEFEESIPAWRAAIHPDDRPRVDRALREHFASDATHLQLELRLRHRDGADRWVLARGASLRSADGRVERLAGSITDVTDRVRAVELLERRVQERTRSLAALLEIGNATAITLELKPLLERILENLAGATGYRGAAVLELAGGRYLPVAVRGELRPDPAAARRAAEARGPVEEGRRLTLPLLLHDEAIGALQLELPEDAPVPAERRPLLAAIATQTAVALENARLTHGVQEKAAFEERQHLARELHDSVSQALYGILLGTHTAQKALDDDPVKAAGALRYVENLAQAGIAEMRALIFELRPESLDKEGLVAVLGKRLDALESRHGLETSFRHDGEPALPFAAKQVLYRVAQEAIHNVVKHARARRVEVALATGPDAVRLEVRDDGVGFDPDGDFPGHLGLQSMRERVHGLGGTLVIDARPGAGACVALEVPRDAS